MASTGFDGVFLMASHVSTLDSRKRVRRTFGQLEEVTNMPNLIDVQRSSYDTFADGRGAGERTDHGLQETFKSVFLIGDFAGRSIWNSCLMNWKFQNMMLKSASNVG